ncbi:MAG: PP2C family protein-serine/threonine phosphatase [Bacteroidota bacterium]
MSSSNFYTQLPLKSQAKFFAAIFCIFAPMFLLSVSSFSVNRSWFEIGAFFVGSGVIAVGYAFAGIRNAKLFALAVPLHMIISIILARSFGGFATFVFSVQGIVSVASIVLGYVLFISFINGQGVKSLRLQTEINLAQQVHSHLVPEISIELPWCEVYGKSISSGEVGGDLIDAVPSTGAMDLFIADVSGHGVKAGVLMSMVKSAIRTKLLRTDALSEVCNDLNRVVHQVKRPEMFVTMAAVRIDEQRNVRYAIAGHPPILHCSRVDGKLHELASKDPGLGLMQEYDFRIQEFQALDGDLLVLLTDGLIEVSDKTGEQLGLEPIKQIILNGSAASPSTIFQSIMKVVSVHGIQDDDQTLLVVRVK